MWVGTSPLSRPPAPFRQGGFCSSICLVLSLPHPSPDPSSRSRGPLPSVSGPLRLLGAHPQHPPDASKPHPAPARRVRIRFPGPFYRPQQQNAPAGRPVLQARGPSGVGKGPASRWFAPVRPRSTVPQERQDPVSRRPRPGFARLSPDHRPSSRIIGPLCPHLSPFDAGLNCQNPSFQRPTPPGNPHNPPPAPPKTRPGPRYGALQGVAGGPGRWGNGWFRGSGGWEQARDQPRTPTTRTQVRPKLGIGGPERGKGPGKRARRDAAGALSSV